MKEDNKQQNHPANKNAQSADAQGQGNTIKNPDDWTTGDEPMTGAQNSYLHTLASEAHEDIDESLSKSDASKKIDELQQKTGRGK